MRPSKSEDSGVDGGGEGHTGSGLHLFSDHQSPHDLPDLDHHPGSRCPGNSEYQDAYDHQYDGQQLQCGPELRADLQDEPGSHRSGSGLGIVLLGFRDPDVCRLPEKRDAVLEMERLCSGAASPERVRPHRDAGSGNKRDLLYGIRGLCRAGVRHGDRDLCGSLHRRHGGDDLLYPRLWPEDSHVGPHRSRPWGAESGETERHGKPQRHPYSSTHVLQRTHPVSPGLSPHVSLYPQRDCGFPGSGHAAAGGPVRAFFRADDCAGGNLLRPGPDPVCVLCGDLQHVGDPDPVHLSLCKGMASGS